jgi:uncharacterized membrane protein
MEREARRRRDDPSRDLAVGALLFFMAAGLDTGRIPLIPLVLLPLLTAAVQRRLIWPRAGFARERTAVVAEMALLFGLSFLALLAVAVSVGVEGMTGLPAGPSRLDRSRLVSVAALLALPGLLAVLGVRHGQPRYAAYAAAILLAFAAGPVLGLEARAWALALLGVAIVLHGGLRLRAFLKRNPVVAEADGEEDPSTR